MEKERKLERQERPVSYKVGVQAKILIIHKRNKPSYTDE